MASQVAIKQLGTNGGGFFNVNSAHPFENSTPFNNFVEMWAILVLPFAFAFTFGRMVKDKRQGYAVFAVMFIVWFGDVDDGDGLRGERQSRRSPTAGSATRPSPSTQAGGNMEGKEVRFGSAASGLWAASTTGTSNGSVNSMHDSFTPLGGAVPLSHMMLGEISPGGVGVGLSGLLVMAILSVFIAGLMVGRTPEYLGKKIQAPEMKMVALYVLAMPTAVLGFAAASLYVPSVLHTTIWNPGQHGFTEILYAFTSASEQQRLGVRRDHRRDHVDGHDARASRCSSVGSSSCFPVLALAGAFARKRVMPATAGTFPTHTPLFVGLVIGVVVIVGGLTFFPAIALGPLVEQLSF